MFALHRDKSLIKHGLRGGRSRSFLHFPQDDAVLPLGTGEFVPRVEPKPVYKQYFAKENSSPLTDG